MDQLVGKIFVVVIIFMTVIFLLTLYKKLTYLGKDNPLLYLIYSVITASFFQSLAFLIATKDRIIDTVVIDSHVEEMPITAVALMISFLLFSLALLFFLRKVKIRQINMPPSLILKKSRLLTIFVLTAIVVLGSLAVFAVTTGTSLVQLLVTSEKRLVMSEYGASTFESHGHLRILAKMAMPLFLFYVASFIYIKRKPSHFDWFIILSLAILAFIPAFTFSNRGAIAYAGISIMVMLLVAGRLNFRKALFFGIIGIVTFSVMSAFRYGVDFYANPFIGLESYFYYGGGNSIFNNTMILEYVLKDGQLKLGESYLGALSFPVPRVLWPEKPLIALDEFNAYMVYKIGGAGAQAIPAGMLGELMLNFGIFFLPIGIILFAFLVAYSYKFVISTKNPFLSFLMRTIIFPRFFMKLIGSGFGFAIMEAFIIGLPIFLIYWICIRYDGFNLVENDKIKNTNLNFYNDKPILIS